MKDILKDYVCHSTHEADSTKQKEINLQRWDLKAGAFEQLQYILFLTDHNFAKLQLEVLLNRPMWGEYCKIDAIKQFHQKISRLGSLVFGRLRRQ